MTYVSVADEVMLESSGGAARLARGCLLAGSADDDLPVVNAGRWAVELPNRWACSWASSKRCAASAACLLRAEGQLNA